MLKDGPGRRTIAGVRPSNLFNVPGKPFGWAHHEERRLIREHLRRRIWKFGLDGKAAMRLEDRVSKIQRRLHRYDLSYRELQKLYAIANPPRPASPSFTAEELERLVELFAGANDPVTQSIGEKAKFMLDSLNPPVQDQDKGD